MAMLGIYVIFFGGFPTCFHGFLWWFTVGIQQADRLRGRDFPERLGWLCLGPSYLGGDEEIGIIQLDRHMFTARIKPPPPPNFCLGLWAIGFP